ncbi:AAA family ATPase [Marinobacter sp.]|uniref:AAA family ATPase n=1 Tax=Marinobacter sp. TaxID=50741 RepID=UPI003298C092
MKELVPKAQIENVSVLAVPHHLKDRHEAEVSKRRHRLQECIENNKFSGHVEVSENNRINYEGNSLLSFIFSHWDGETVGVMHLTTAERQFNRTQINSVNINLNNLKDQSANHSLYGTNNRYSQFQNQLASHTAYSALRKDLGLEHSEDNYFQDSLGDLFEKFIPGKKYIGPDFDDSGSLDFFVETKDGIKHGINDLSSGEKQILFGYIELFNSAPKNSILMIDEPELHLNPRLVRSLPDFYDQHIGRHFNNQLWLITHSDALLREACKSSNFSVFHMTSDTENGNQLVAIGENNETDNAIMDLVGDIGQLTNSKPITFIEGANSELDKDIIETFFPEQANKISLVSSGNKADAISSFRRLTKVPGFSEKERKVFALVDKDHGKEKSGPNIFSWDRFHIENFLLDETAIFEVTKDLGEIPNSIKNSDDVLELLRDIAQSVLVSLSNEYVQSQLNSRILNNINLKIDYRNESAYQDLNQKVILASEKITIETSKIIDDDIAKTLFNYKISELNKSLESGEWKKLVRGRDVLQKYAAEYTPVKYKIFVSLLKNKIKALGKEPMEMLNKLKNIIEEE